MGAKATERTRPRVLVWHWTWLPGSETFIRVQLETLNRWDGVAVGALRVPSAIARDDDVILFAPTALGKIQRTMFRLGIGDWIVTKRMKALRPDVIHAHFAGDGFRVLRVARRLGVPLVVTVHGADVTATPREPGWRGRRNRRRLRRVFRSAAHVIAVSHHIEREALRWGAEPSRMSVIPIGVADHQFPEARRAAHTVVAVGRFVPKKGFDYLLRALGELDPPLRDVVRLRLIGDGPERDKLVRMARELGVMTDFLGFVPPAQVAREMTTCTVVAVPSVTAPNGDTEGLPTVVFEALRAGTPVIGFRHAGIPEAVDDGVSGLLAQEGDISGLARNCAQVLCDPGYATRLGIGARLAFEERFDAAVQTAHLQDVYDSVTRSEREQS